MADGGTLFIDEIGEMAGSLQAKLLRVLEDGSMRRIGSVKERRVDVRLLAATNRDLAEEVAGRAVPRGPVLPHQRDVARAAAAARAAGRYSAARAALLGRGLDGRAGGAAGHGSIHLAGQRAATRSTPSSVRRSWPTTNGSNWPDAAKRIAGGQRPTMRVAASVPDGVFLADIQRRTSWKCSSANGATKPERRGRWA